MIALVQRPARKMHAGSLAPGATDWVTLCDRLVADAGAATWPDASDAIAVAEAKPGTVCVHCHRTLLMADLMTRAALTRLGLAA